MHVVKNERLQYRKKENLNSIGSSASFSGFKSVNGIFVEYRENITRKTKHDTF